MNCLSIFIIFKLENRQYLQHYWLNKRSEGTVVNRTLPFFAWKVTWNYAYSPFKRVIFKFSTINLTRRVSNRRFIQCFSNQSYSEKWDNLGRHFLVNYSFNWIYVYMFVNILAIAGKTVGPNSLTFFRKPMGTLG